LSKAQPKNAIITPPKFGNDFKQASLLSKTNKYFHIKKKHYRLARAQFYIFLQFSSFATTEQMPALVFKWFSP
jgi:hypothetical protein